MEATTNRCLHGYRRLSLPLCENNRQFGFISVFRRFNKRLSDINSKNKKKKKKTRKKNNQREKGVKGEKKKQRNVSELVIVLTI